LKISKIFLHDEPAVQEIQISNLKNFLLKTFHVDVEIKECIFNNLDVKDVEKISGCRIFEPKIFHLNFCILVQVVFLNFLKLAS